MSTTKTPNFAQRIESLPPLPDIVPAILDATTSDTASAEQVAAVLGRDPTVAAKVLRIANSPFYSPGREITDVTRAVVRLGVMAVRNLVIGVCAGSAMRSTGRARKTHGLLWRHSVATAAAAELTARRISYKQPEEAFIAGLLHNFGQLAMLVTEAGLFEQVAERTARGGMKFLYRERQAFGMDHTEAGAALMRHWGLPAALIDAAQHHHAGDADALTRRPLVAVVALADTLAQRLGMGMDLAAGVSSRTDAAIQALGLTGDDAFHIAQALPGRVVEAGQMLGSAEPAPGPVDAGRSLTAVWVSPHGQPPDDMTRLLLETRGYRARVCLAEELESIEDHDLVLFVGATDVCPGVAGIELVDGLPMREASDNLGRCRIPQEFSVFDLAWAEGRLS
ncbi:MAG: HDOD domain-containing protein [Planctomycetota bacterium]